MEKKTQGFTQEIFLQVILALKEDKLPLATALIMKELHCSINDAKIRAEEIKKVIFL
ncbi:hypothetical protein [Flavobacterium sp. J27]|uniref:hypothetical protein n=1 Tax=Flavobacterium sp. J27 TaxID=2060419 RepID=UPI0013EE910A|nr:hypothetical protein [Flavobacterium sp. J27]